MVILIVVGVTMREYRASSLALAVVSLYLERLVPHHWLQATHTICGMMKVRRLWRIEGYTR